MDHLRQDLHHQEQNHRAIKAKEQLEENKKIYNEIRQRNQTQKQKEEELNQREIQAQVSGSFLTENPNQALSVYGQHR
jgi:osmotically-inducible protein OsmY